MTSSGPIPEKRQTENGEDVVSTTATTTISPANDSDANSMMLRLQSQFGDMDLSHLLLEKDAHAAGQQDDHSSSSSSLAEPTPEEIKAWQEAQFQKGQTTREAQRKETMGAVQKRREALKEQRQRNGVLGDEEDWEYLEALPNLQGQSSVFFPTTSSSSEVLVGVHPRLQELSQKGDPDILGTSWQRLYGSTHGDGLSFARLWQSLQGYPGPTILLLGTVPAQSKQIKRINSSSESVSRVLGFYTTSPWIESSTMTGSSDCFLFSFDDDDSINDAEHEESSTISFFRPKSTQDHDATSTSAHGTRPEQHYMYCYPSSGSKYAASAKTTSTNGIIHGIGIGGNPSQPRLHISESLEDCRALSYCSLLETGDLFGSGATAKAYQESLQYFDVTALEVWAVGGKKWIDESLQSQKRHRAVVQANQVKARSVDKQQLLRDFQSGMFSTGSTAGVDGGGMFAHRNNYGAADRCDV